MRFVGFAVSLALGLAPALGCGHRGSPADRAAPTGAAVGAVAPAAQLTAASGTRLALADVLHQHARTVLVFYRGFW